MKALVAIASLLASSGALAHPADLATGRVRSCAGAAAGATCSFVEPQWQASLEGECVQSEGRLECAATRVIAPSKPRDPAIGTSRLALLVLCLLGFVAVAVRVVRQE